jgi:outer membrane receptor protein involved in Fe transport
VKTPLSLSVIILLAFLLGISIPGANAEEVDPENPFTMSLAQLMQVEITGATLTEKSLKNVPAAVTVFTREEIRRLGMDYLHELLNLVPGYQSQRYSDMSTGSYYSSRGRRQGPNSREVLLLLDGRPMNDPRTNGPAFGTRLPLGQIERVEIIRGPGSAIYGSNAFTGVINVITISDENQATLSAGTDNLQQGEIHLSGRNDEWYAKLFAHGAHEGGQDYTVPDPYGAGFLTTSDPARSGDFDMTIGHGKTKLSLLHRQVSTDDFYTAELLANGFNEASSKDTLVTLEQSWNWNPNFTSHLMLGYRQNDVTANIQVTAPGALQAISSPSSDEPLLSRSNLKSDAQYLKIDNNWDLDGNSSLQGGMELRRDVEVEASSHTNYDLAQFSAIMKGQATPPVSYYGTLDNVTQVGTEENRNMVGLYSQYQRPLWEEAELTLGVRYDKYNGIDGMLSPRAALVQQLNPIHSLKLLYGEAFRAPTLAETGLLNNPIISSNPDLKNESIQTWDLIWIAQWQKLGLNFGGFHNHIKDPIALKNVNNIRTYANLDEDDTSQGLEFETSYQISPPWLLRATLTRFLQLPDSALREAKTLGSLMVNYEKDLWNFNLVGVYHGQRDMYSGSSILTLDDYWVVNGKICYQVSKKWLLFTQAKNLLNEDYQTTVWGNGLEEGIPNRGRELALGVTWKF